MKQQAVAQRRRNPRHSKFRVGRVAAVLPANTSLALHQHVARLSVLFEDLRIELGGMSGPQLDAVGLYEKKLRQMYFLRRSIGTLSEFAEGLRLLDNEPEFDLLRQNFAPQAQRMWTRATSHFRRCEASFKRIRNDIGGHFGADAARYAVRNLLPLATGAIEIGLYDTGGGARLYFASEVAATAALRHLRGDTPESRVRKLYRASMVAYRHAIRAVECITVHYLWDRFGR